MVMTKGQLIRAIDAAKVEAAIAAAERATSGEIRVTVAPFFWGSVEKAADAAFARLGMTRTELRNGVLIFVVPSRRKFVVLGDRGIHEKVGQTFWNEVAGSISERFRTGDFTGGLMSGIEKIGEQLAAHFPFDEKGDRNELSNIVDFA